jgi:hypothetical protein
MGGLKKLLPEQATAPLDALDMSVVVGEGAAA